MADIETRLRELLLPVFGLASIDALPPTAALVNEIGADSLDFVEITYLIERDFGVVLKPGELVAADAGADGEVLFADGQLTAAGLRALREQLSEDGERFAVGMTKMDLFRTITVRDLARLIRRRGGGSGS